MFRIILKNKYTILSQYKILLPFLHIHIKELNKLKSDSLIDKFFQLLIMPNQTSKQTEKYRFVELDKYILKYLFNKKNILIHDIAVSSGITSLELYDVLETNNVSFDLYISDKFSKVYYSKCGKIECLYDINKNIFTLYIFGIYASNLVSNKFFFSKLLFKLLNNRCKKSNYMSEILLLHPEISEHIDKKLINFINYDIFHTKIDKKFNFIRLMNILNLAYFREKEILSALKNIIYSLNEDGILLIGRTIENVNHATFFKKIKNQIIVLESVNKGSEIEMLVLKINEIL